MVKKLILIFLFLISFLLIAHFIQVQNTVVKSEPTMYSLSEKENGTTLSVVAGDTLKISLKGNITTGFEWEIAQNDSSLLQSQGKFDYQPEKTELEGSGGTFIFTFKAMRKGENLLKLIYHRSFEKNVPPEQEYKLIVKIK